jgi:hypothetical protein
VRAGSFLLAFIAIAIAVVCVAPAAAAPPRSDFIRKGDALCAQVKRELAPIRARAVAAQGLPMSKQWSVGADIWADQIRIQKRFVQRFHDLGIPANDARARQIVSGLDRGLVLAGRVQKAFAARKAAAIGPAVRDYLTFTLKLNAQVVAYGFRVCGR